MWSWEREPEDRGRAAGQRWLARLWLALVVVLTVGYWWLSYRFNPANVPMLVVLAVGWLWMVVWWAVHNRFRLLETGWFGPRVLVVALSFIGLVWSALFAMQRDQILARSTSPDNQHTAVVTGTPRGTVFHIGAESWGGLVIDRVTTVSLVGTGVDGKTPPGPSRVEIGWYPETGMMGVSGDGLNLAILDYNDAGLHERPDTRTGARRFIEAAYPPPAADSQGTAYP